MEIDCNARCPYCGTRNEVTTGVSGSLLPSDGSISICMSCDEPGRFVVNGLGIAVRALTGAEMARIKAHWMYRAYLAAMTEARRARG